MTLHVVYLNRSRIDLLSGWLGGLRRFLMRGRRLDGFRENLQDVVDRVEASCMAPEAAVERP